MMIDNFKFGVVIPCYKIPTGLLDVINSIPDFVDLILVIDDACPLDSVKPQLIEANMDPRVIYHRNECNAGVGGAFYTGFKLAKQHHCTLIAKLDGDGQHCGKNLLKYFDEIILAKADFVKGNRFFSSSIVSKMPTLRLIGNSMVSLMSKFSSGYWSIMDPTYGKFATSVACLDCLDWSAVGRRYTFETTLLCALSLEFSKVVQVREISRYGNETSGLSPLKVILPLFSSLVTAGMKRIIHQYFLRSFSIVSFLLPAWLFIAPYTIYFINKARESAALLDSYSAPGTVAIALLLMLVTLVLPLIIFCIDILGEPRRAQNFWK